MLAFVRRRSLHSDPGQRSGLHPENQQKMTDQPTAERLRKAFADVSLPRRKQATGEDIGRRLPPLSAFQEDSRPRLGVGTSLYRQLEMHKMRQ